MTLKEAHILTLRVLKQVMEEHGHTDVGGEVRKTVGDVAASIILSECDANVAVVQAAHVALD